MVPGVKKLGGPVPPVPMVVAPMGQEHKKRALAEKRCKIGPKLLLGYTD